MLSNSSSESSDLLSGPTEVHTDSPTDFPLLEGDLDTPRYGGKRPSGASGSTQGADANVKMEPDQHEPMSLNLSQRLTPTPATSAASSSGEASSLPPLARASGGIAIPIPLSPARPARNVKTEQSIGFGPSSVFTFTPPRGRSLRYHREDVPNEPPVLSKESRMNPPQSMMPQLPSGSLLALGLGQQSSGAPLPVAMESPHIFAAPSVPHVSAAVPALASPLPSPAAARLPPTAAIQQVISVPQAVPPSSAAPPVSVSASMSGSFQPASLHTLEMSVPGGSFMALPKQAAATASLATFASLLPEPIFGEIPAPSRVFNLRPREKDEDSKLMKATKGVKKEAKKRAAVSFEEDPDFNPEEDSEEDEGPEDMMVDEQDELPSPLASAIPAPAASKSSGSSAEQMDIDIVGSESSSSAGSSSTSSSSSSSASSSTAPAESKPVRKTRGRKRKPLSDELPEAAEEGDETEDEEPGDKPKAGRGRPRGRGRGGRGGMTRGNLSQREHQMLYERERRRKLSDAFSLLRDAMRLKDTDSHTHSKLEILAEAKDMVVSLRKQLENANRRLRAFVDAKHEKAKDKTDQEAK